MRKRVMLVDDHPAMLMALESILKDQLFFEVVGKAHSGEACLNSIKEINPNMLILDLDMPKKDGFDVIRRVRLLHPKVRILVLSSMDEAVYGGRVRSLGAHGFVNKAVGLEIILAACVAISQDYNFFTHGKNGNTSLTDNDKLASISDRELQIMKYLGKGNTSQQISDRLHISNKTVATYKTRLFDKLGIDNLAALILFCRINHITES